MSAARLLLVALSCVYSFVVSLVSSIFRYFLEKTRITALYQYLRQTPMRMLLSQVVSLLLIVSILTVSTPAAPQLGFIASFSEFGVSLHYALAPKIEALELPIAATLASAEDSALSYAFLFNPVLAIINGAGKIFKKQQQRAIERVVVLPNNESGTLTVMQGQKIDFTAVGLDKDGQPVGGMPVVWSVTDTGRKIATRGIINGEFAAAATGTFIVVGAMAGKQAQVTVVVSVNPAYAVKRALDKQELDRTSGEKKLLQALTAKGILKTRNISSKGIHDPAEERRFYEEEKQLKEKIKHLPANQLPVKSNVSLPARGGPSAGDEETQPQPDVVSDDAANEPKESKTSAVPMFRSPDTEGWDGSNYYTADDPKNRVGIPQGEAPAGGAGNGNFTISAPLVSLGGRGIPVNLALTYNARLWGKAGNTVFYDPDRGNPAPGWTTGFGKMMYMGGNGGCMLVDGSGTRRSYDGSSSIWSTSNYYSNNYYGHTTDGSFIDYDCWYTQSGGLHTFVGNAKMADGTQITYSSGSSAGDQVYPVQIKDAQGNYINITYVNNEGPNIQTVTDTLGRTISFNYDGNGRLVSLTGPGQNGGSRVYARLHYNQLSLNYAFASGITADTPTNSPYVLDAIYYPDTNTGYWFGDSDSYSSYGMIAKVMQMRGMSWSGANVNDQGAVSMGMMSDQMVYNFTLGPDSSLTDAPLYTQMTETWTNSDTPNGALTQFNVASNSTDEVVTVTAPNGTKSRQTTHNDPASADYGQYYQNETLAANGTVLGTMKTYLQTGDYGTTRPIRTETTDEKLQTTAIEYSYGANYNQVTQTRQYNYANQLYRYTNTAYLNNAAYTNRHIFNLVTMTELADGGSNARLSRTDYQYDNNAVANGTGNPNLVNTPGVVMHDSRYDPFTTETYQGPCTSGEFNYPQCSYDGEIIYMGDYPQYEAVCSYQCYEYAQVNAYDPNSIYRGNVTKVTTYADAQNLAGAIDYDSTYDETGNARTTTTDCCQQMSFNYTTGTQYSQPESHTKGSSDPNNADRMTEYAGYDFNTGHVNFATDFNGLTTNYNYDAVGRLYSTIFPTGAFQVNAVNDANLLTENYTMTAANTRAGYALTYYTGRGQAKRTLSYTGGNPNFWDASNFTETNVKYDEMGRQTEASVPFNNAVGNPSNLHTTYQYDQLSRVNKVTAPDGSVSETFYNEASLPAAASSTTGQTVRSRDAWGRERWARADDWGRMVEVVEPDPAGSGSVFDPNHSGNLGTSYAYDAKDQLVTVYQGLQQRWFAYDSLGRLTRQKLAEQTATINAAGQYVGASGGGAQWSDAFVYDARSNLIQRTDARGVKTNFSYQTSYGTDALNRLRQVTYDTSGASAAYPIQGVAPVTLGYMTAGDKTRVAQVQSAGGWTEQNHYDAFSRIDYYKIQSSLRPSEPWQTDYAYDSVNRLTQITYPNQWGVAGAPRKVVAPSYDEASRLSALQVDNQIQLDQIQYNPLSQVTALMTGNSTPHPNLETYAYDQATGLLTEQTVLKAGPFSHPNQYLMKLSYDYSRGNSGGSGSQTAKTGQLTKITNNLDHNKDRLYEYDAVGRLAAANGGLAAGATATGTSANWFEHYQYDRYGNRLNVIAAGNTANQQPIPADGYPNRTYDQTSNRDQNLTYDFAGSVVADQSANQAYEYDAAGRLSAVKVASTGNLLTAQYYASTRQRIAATVDGGSTFSYYVWGGQSVIAEYASANGQANSIWQKSYIYAGSRLLSTFTNDQAGGETLEFDHPDRLGTKLVTDASGGGGYYEQSTLPFGTNLPAETTGATNQRFTSYDRNATTGLDYAVNRTYSPAHGRFTSVDPIGMSAASITNPQSMNLYAYAQNNPVDYTDPSGLLRAALDDVIRISTWALPWGWADVFFSGIDASYGGDFDWLYDPYYGGDFDGGSGGNGSDDLDKRNPCERLADRAQKVADEAIEWAKKTGGDALSMFDMSFTPYYIGRIVTEGNAYYFYETGGGKSTESKLNPNEYGQEDFKEDFIDIDKGRYERAVSEDGKTKLVDDKGHWSDQVHHFVAYFSGGINDAKFAMSAHSLTDVIDWNPGDYWLGQKARTIGYNLRKDPSLLGSIGKTIKDEICRPK